MLSVADKPIMLFPKSLWTFLVFFHSKGDFQSNIKLQDKAASDTLTAPWPKLKLKKCLKREKENSRS